VKLLKSNFTATELYLYADEKHINFTKSNGNCDGYIIHRMENVHDYCKHINVCTHAHKL
jgi:hypothetical protein